MKIKTFLILAAIASFLYGVAQMKMSVPYCREIVKQDMIAAKQYQESLIDELARAGQ